MGIGSLLDLHDSVVPTDFGLLAMETGWATQQTVGQNVAWPHSGAKFVVRWNALWLPGNMR